MERILKISKTTIWSLLMLPVSILTFFNGAGIHELPMNDVKNQTQPSFAAVSPIGAVLTTNQLSDTAIKAPTTIWADVSDLTLGSTATYFIAREVESELKDFNS